RMAVGPKLRLTVQRKKIEPMPQRRQGIAGAWSRIVTIERGRQGCDRHRGRNIGDGFLPPDPSSQMVNVQRRLSSHDVASYEGRASLARRRCGAASSLFLSGDKHKIAVGCAGSQFHCLLIPGAGPELVEPVVVVELKNHCSCFEGALDDPSARIDNKS